VLSNLLFAGSLSYYHYTQFLGYSGAAVGGSARSRADRAVAALPFLERTELFLYPIGAIVAITPFSMLLGCNPTRFVLSLYFG